jgi:NTE family protein
VILDEGSLAFAMRASMSIPSIFRPVPYEGTLLVDGGVLNNFPTDVAKSMGADIIIGSDVGGGMAPIEDLDNIATIMFQTGMLTSNLSNPEHQKLCTILIDHVPNLTYSTGDFVKGREIYEEGKIATNLNLDALVTLSQQLNGYPKKVHQLPETKDEFILDTISYTGISKGNLALVKARANIKTNVPYTVQDIIEGINRAMGTNLFSQITTNYIANGDKIGLQINGFEHTTSQIKGAIHFDTYRGVGVLVNYTGRNILGDASRILATVDIAQQPRFRVEYQKIFGKDKSWWWGSEVYGDHLIQEIFIEGVQVDDMKYRSLIFDNQINKNFNSLRSYMGLGIDYQYTNLKPKNDPEYSDNVYNLNNYNFNSIEMYMQYVYNSLNEPFYATDGSFFHATVGRSLLQDVNLTYYQDDAPPADGKTNGYTKLALNYETRFPVHEKITGIVVATGSFIFQDELADDEYSFTDYGYAEKYFIGGNLIVPKKDSYAFPGLYEGELSVSEFLRLSLGIQFNPINKVYITPNFNIASVGYGTFTDYIDNAFTPNSNWQDTYETSLLMSAGAGISYNSFLGPINFDMSWVNDINKVRLFFSVGFVFNPSIR